MSASFSNRPTFAVSNISSPSSLQSYTILSHYFRWLAILFLYNHARIIDAPISRAIGEVTTDLLQWQCL